MPCDSIVLNTLDVPKMDPKLLRAGLEHLGAFGISQGASVTAFTLDGVRVTIQNGRITVPAGYEHIADQVKRGYSRQVTIYAARKNGWTAREVRPYVFQVTK
jgi:hypothetical protein